MRPAQFGRQRLVDRAKLVLAGDPARRWTLAEVARRSAGFPGIFTQVFQQVEGQPLYRYQLRLRLARALDLLAQYDDLTALGLALGFSSHSHFSAAFREVYGRTPSEFRNPDALRPPPPRRRLCVVSDRNKEIAKDSDSDSFSQRGLLILPRLWVSESNVMVEKTCAACDCKLETNSIKVGIGGKTVEVCCEECSHKLKEARESTAAREG